MSGVGSSEPVHELSSQELLMIQYFMYIVHQIIGLLDWMFENTHNTKTFLVSYSQLKH